MSEPTREPDRLQRGVDLVVEVLGGCDHAGVTIAQDGRLQTPAASDDTVRTGDAWQYELGEGPCLEAIARERTVVSQDLRAERRWPRWTARVKAGLGVQAMMSVRLFAGSDTYGALNLYADRRHAWSGEDVGLACTLAGHLATSIADAREIAQRTRALTCRTMVGQAQGILMERLGLDADQALGHLRRLSQATHRELSEIAHDLVDARRLPDPLPDVGEEALGHGGGPTPGGRP